VRRSIDARPGRFFDVECGTRRTVVRLADVER
jgi:hypothetical protein